MPANSSRTGLPYIASYARAVAKLHLQVGINDRPGLQDGEKQSQRACNE
jgi:hypothetical protein